MTILQLPSGMNASYVLPIQQDILSDMSYGLLTIQCITHMNKNWKFTHDSKNTSVFLLDFETARIQVFEISLGA
ncbi:hypothetical protein WMW72_22055 [Paenibacillus filicis]|uniref:Uncharacterized protein n=1 Tax=Paenibacillus filicis TaxID=669464 RepID=A0ABU9DNY8_9BACL